MSPLHLIFEAVLGNTEDFSSMIQELLSIEVFLAWRHLLSQNGLSFLQVTAFRVSPVAYKIHAEDLDSWTSSFWSVLKNQSVAKWDPMQHHLPQERCFSSLISLLHRHIYISSLFPPSPASFWAYVIEGWRHDSVVRVPDIIAEKLGSVPSHHMEVHNHPFRDTMTSGLHVPCIHMWCPFYK